MPFSMSSYVFNISFYPLPWFSMLFHMIMVIYLFILI